jgi:hypothetical protein
MEAQDRIAELVLQVHRRNGGALTSLDPTWRLLDPQLRLDSLDLAELMVAIEREFRSSPFDAPKPPRTWGEVAAAVTRPGTPPSDPSHS